jgi:hypothetical protein
MVFMVDKDRISATTKLSSLATRIAAVRLYAIVTAFEIRLAAPANPLSPQDAFLYGGAQLQHKTILPIKTNLSPAHERLENAADAVNRMQEAKDVQKSAADNSCFGYGLGVISPEAPPAPGTS